MGILTRIMRLCKADLHGVMDQLEDKALLLKQYLREMQAGLLEKENQLDHISRQEENIQRDLQLRGEDIARLEKDLALSLRKDKDDIAKLFIRKQLIQKAACDQLQQQLRALEGRRQRLGRLLEDQRRQYDQLKVKVAAFHCRERQHAFMAADSILRDMGDGWAIDEKEIEIEFLRRKETLQAGGEA